MNLRDKKAWLERYGSVMKAYYNEQSLQHYVKWWSYTGMKFMGSGDTSDDAYENVFMDVVETLYHNCR